MRCHRCKRGLDDGVALFRQNPKGEAGIWACGDCNMTPVDKDIQDLVDIVKKPEPPPTVH